MLLRAAADWGRESLAAGVVATFWVVTAAWVASFLFETRSRNSYLSLRSIIVQDLINSCIKSLPSSFSMEKPVGAGVNWTKNLSFAIASSSSYTRTAASKQRLVRCQDERGGGVRGGNLPDRQGTWWTGLGHGRRCFDRQHLGWASPGSVEASWSWSWTWSECCPCWSAWGWSGGGHPPRAWNSGEKQGPAWPFFASPWPTAAEAVLQTMFHSPASPYSLDKLKLTRIVSYLLINQSWGHLTIITTSLRSAFTTE